MNKYTLIFHLCCLIKIQRIWYFSPLPTAVLHLHVDLAHDLHTWLFVPTHLGKGHAVQTLSTNPQEQSSLFQEPSLTGYSQSLVDHSSSSPTQMTFPFPKLEYVSRVSHAWDFFWYRVWFIFFHVLTFFFTMSIYNFAMGFKYNKRPEGNHTG